MLGRTLGHYRVLEKLGEGGMGEVYRAHDTKLGRDVAIKVLPAAVARDPERLARLEREARVLASVNHPNVATLYGLEDEGDVPFLVMELVEGETLHERISRGPLFLEEALPLFQRIARGLEAAHEKGVIHRDLKPANVKVAPGGDAKVLDFGLAKIFSGEVASSTSSDAPTITRKETENGVILGTAAYMSPEQARGRPLDKRTDVWSFGCCLYEALSGRAAFLGETVSDTLANILQREPDAGALPRGTPARIRNLISRCLVKDPLNRLRDIGDARIELQAAATEPALVEDRRRPRSWSLMGAIVALAAITFVLWAWLRPSDTAPREPVRMVASLPSGMNVTRGPGFALSSVALSPDGRTLVIGGTDEDGQRLYERPLDRLEATPLAGAEGGSNPFFSPDGAWIGFFAAGRLKRLPAGGGAAVDIATVPGSGFPAGASWGSDDRIVFASGARSALYAVDARGGELEPITMREQGERSHSNPEILPGGGALLLEVDGWVHTIDLESGRRTALVQGSAPRFADPGALILRRGRSLLAAPFDASRLELEGPVVPLVEGVVAEGRHYAISRSGTLAYVPGVQAHALVMVEPDGTERLVTEERVTFENPQFSPDGRRLVVATRRRAGESMDLWIHDLETGSASRLTFDHGRAPVWTPDGDAVTYSHLGERGGIYTKPADGLGDPEQVVALDEFHWLVGWTPDGRTLAFGLHQGDADEAAPSTSIVALVDGESRRIVGPGNIWGGRLSPDGQWLAYYTLESGRFEVYVTRFPEAGTRWQISQDGGRDPSWAPEGTEVYYRSGDRLMAARIDTKSGVRVLARRLVFEPFSPPLFDDYDIHPDGRTLVQVQPVGDTSDRAITVVLHWSAELRKMMAR